MKLNIKGVGAESVLIFIVLSGMVVSLARLLHVGQN